MDPELLTAVNQGDVKHLIKLCETRNHDIFLAQENQHNLTMLHILSSHGKQACIDETLKRLPVRVVRKLLCQTNKYGNNPLHDAASYGHPNIAKLLVAAYQSSDDGVDLSCPPWRAKNNQGQLPVQVAVHTKHDEVAALLVSIDSDFACKFDNTGSLLSESVSFGCKRTVKAILTSGVEYSTQDIDVHRIMKLIQNCSESDAVLLLQQHPELARSQDCLDKKTILHHATEQNLVDIIKTILNIDTSISYTLLDLDGQNPLHIAVKLGCIDIAQILVDAFNNYLKRQVEGDKEAAVQGSNSSPLIQEEHAPVIAASLLSFQPPWRQIDRNGNTPLHLAFLHGHRKFAAYMLSSDLAFLSCLANSDEKPLISHVMEQEGFKDVAEHILTLDGRHSLMDVYLETFLQFLKESPENATIALLKQHPELVQFKDASGRAILQFALDENDVQTMNLILKVQPSAVDIKDDEQEHLLIKACRKGNLSAIHVICDICPQACARNEEQTTALHNVRLQSREEYRALLSIPVLARLKNKTDALGRSPLIKAIQDNNFHLVETLLEMEGVDVMNIKRQDGKTAAALLKDKSKESTEWANLYKEATQATSYIPLGTDLKDMRNTLSVVAALLATITFAAAFTVPGGFDQNNGVVLLGRKPAFIVFILSDTYAMCCSMIVLYALIWATVQEPDKASVLIDYSVVLLHHSLYGTLGAFMTGVYTMLSPKSIWVAIIVLVMCSTIVISAYLIIHFKLVDKFIKTGTTKRRVAKKEAELSEILLS